MATKFSPSPDTRVIVTYSPACNSAIKNSEIGVNGHLLRLRNPKTGLAACYMIIGGIFQELHWFKQRCTSWFIGDFVCEEGGSLQENRELWSGVIMVAEIGKDPHDLGYSQQAHKHQPGACLLEACKLLEVPRRLYLRDGSTYFASPFDPIFMVLPILEVARMKKGDDLGKFRALEDMMFVDGYPGYMYLVPLLQNSLETVCEVRDVGHASYFRLDDSKVLAWLLCKVKKISKALQLSQTSFSGMSQEDMNTYVVGLLGEFLPLEPWLHLLCRSLSVDPDAIKTGRCVAPTEIFTVQPTLESKQQGSSLVKSGTSKKGPPPGARKITSFFARPR